MKAIILILSIAIVLGFGAIWLYALPTPPSPQITAQPNQPTGSPQQQTTQPPITALATSTPIIGPVNTTPTMVTLNMPTPVTITAQITDPTLIPGSVNLLRLGATGTPPTILGVMHDDGQNGDAVAGDGVYTLQALFNEVALGQIQLQVSAAFRGQLRRVTANFPPIQVTVPQTFTNSDIGMTISYPAGWYMENGETGLIFSNTSDTSSLPFTDLGFFELEYAPHANPAGLPIDQWASQFSNNIPESALSSTVVSIAGQPALRVITGELVADTILYIPRGTDIIRISYNSADGQFLGEYQAMLNSIIFTR
jgi:hypothetical protein